MSFIDDAITDMAAIEWYEQLLNTPVPKMERETTFMTNDIEKRFIVQTQSRSLQKKIEKLGIKPGGITFEGTPLEKWYSVPKDYVSIRKPRKGNPDIAEQSNKGVEARKEKNKPADCY